MDYTEKLKKYISDEIMMLENLDLSAVDKLINMMDSTQSSGHKIYICGNGGSAATASHFVCDFEKGVNENTGSKYDFECLSDNTPRTTAIANDISYEDIFVFPLKLKLKKGDMVIGISGSGNSEDVIRAIKYAKEQGVPTAVLVGYDGGKLKTLADHSVHVNINNMQIVEDIHMALDHMMMYVLAH